MAARWVEEWVLPRSDAVMVVVDESRDRLRGLGVPSERMAVVGNTPPLARLERPRADHGIVRRAGAQRAPSTHAGLDDTI